MSWFSGFAYSLRSLFRRAAADKETAEEISYHLQRQAEKHIAAGIDAGAARALAVNELGGAGRWREETADARAGRVLDSIGQDARYAVRTLRRQHGFTALALLTVAIGVGGAVAAYSLVDHVLLRPLPYREPSRLVELVEANQQSDAFPFSMPNLVDVRAQARSFESIGAAMLMSSPVETKESTSDVLGGSVTGQFFDALGVGVLAGRGLTPEDSRPGARPSIVLGHGLWQRMFAGDHRIIGRPVQFGSAKYVVVGIAQPGFAYPAGAEYWVACRWCDHPPPRTRATISGMTVARLAPGVTLAQARAEVAAIAERIHEQYPNPADNQMTTARVVPLHEAVVGHTRKDLAMLGAAVTFVLLIGCTNLASANLARNRSRLHELALRAALGAARRRIVQQLAVESLVLSLAGGAAGLLLARWTVSLVVHYGASRLPRLAELRLDARAVLFALGVSMVVALLIGFLPAVRLSSRDLRGSLAGGGRGTTGGRGRFRDARLRDLLVAAEIGLAVVLLVAAGLAVRSLQLVYRQPIGVDPRGLVLVASSVSSAVYRAPGGAVRHHEELLRRITALPGVTHAALASTGPLEMGWTGMIAIDGRAEAASGAGPLAQYNLVTDDYFATLGLRLLRGRLFTTADDSTSGDVTVINRAMAERFWPGGSPLGARIRALNIGLEPERWLTVIGVVSNVRTFSLEEEDSPIHYVSARQRPSLAGASSVIMRTDRAPASLFPELRAIARSLDPAGVTKLSTVEDRIAFTTSERRVTTSLLGSFAGVGLVLAAIGIYGVVSYTVSLRLREFGIRMALGADGGRLIWSTVRSMLRPVVVGLAAGLLVARLVSHVFEALVFHLSPTDPWVIGVASVALMALSVLAAYVPARRGALADPLVALRSE